MYKFISRAPKIQRSFQGGYEVTFYVSEDQGDNIQSLFERVQFGDEEWLMNTQLMRKPKSEQANDYMWVLCDLIADKLGNGASKRDIYIQTVQDVGKFKVIRIPKEQAEYVIGLWEEQGLGWPCKVIDDYDDQVELLCCYGSSTYNSKEESRLVSHLVFMAIEMGIPIDPERTDKKWQERVGE